MDNAVLKRLAHMEARAKGATPGAAAYADEGGWYSLCADGNGGHRCVARFPYKNENWETDIEFYGAALTDLPAATSLIRALLSERRFAVHGTWDEFDEARVATDAALAEFAKGDA